jgi:two-component sensor histidine kinase
MTDAPSSELASLRRWAWNYLQYGTAALVVLLVVMESTAPAVIAWLRAADPSLLVFGLRVAFALLMFAVGLWARLHLWALLVPVVLWLFRRLRVQDDWRRGLRRSLLLGVPVAAGHALVEQGVFTLAELTGRGVYPDFTTSFIQVDTYNLSEWPAAVILLRRVITDYSTYLIIAGICFAYEYFVRYRRQQEQAQALETELVQAQLQALRMQMNPHFLFNTLNAVTVLVRSGETTKAVRTLRLLSDLLRASFQGADVQLVPLREELDLTQRYLDIEQVRFGDRLDVQVDAAEAVQGLQVPYLLLQPLVENAVRHGIAPHADAGTVALRARRLDAAPEAERDPEAARDAETASPDGAVPAEAANEGARLELVVADSGAGFPEDGDVFDQGVGLSNTKRRLEKLYGDRHRFELGVSEWGGAQVRIVLPATPAETPDQDEAAAQPAPADAPDAAPEKVGDGSVVSASSDP